MVTQVMTRQEFYAKYPTFASLDWGSAARQRWLDNHPGAAAQWSAIRDVEQQMTKVYGENWRTSAGEQWYRAVTDYLDGGFGNNPSPPAGAPAPAAPAAGDSSTGGATGGGAPAPTEPTYDRNAYEFLKGVFESYGLGSLAPKILEFAKQGYANDTIEILLRQTDEFKQRFAANDLRLKQGKNALSIGDYLRMESEYQSILSASGLPAGFYDGKDDFTNWIAGDVSPDELRERVVYAQQAALSSDSGVRQQLASYYGLGDNDLVAYFLDPARATSLFETRRVFGTANVGAAAAAQGLSIAKDRASLFADQGIDRAEANTGFANVASALPDAERLSSIYDGADVGQTELEDEFLGGNALASQKRAKLVGKEAANFAGGGGIGRTGLRKRRKGAY